MSETAEEQFDEQRELCPDGSCVGVLDERGVCKVCGAQGTPPGPVAEGPRDPGSGHPGLAALSPRDPGSGQPAGALASADDEAFDEGRELCPDGNCIGVLGADGKCKTCGRSAAS